MKLIIRADDAGSCESADAGIAEAIEAGLTRNVGFMAVGPSLQNAVARLGGRDEICYGLHAVLNAEWQEVKWGPLTRNRALCDENGAFLPSPEQTQSVAELTLADVLAEIAMQLERLRATGLRVSYLDEHMVFSVARFAAEDLPAFWQELPNALADFCAREGLVYFRGFPDLASPDSSAASSDALETLQQRLQNTPHDVAVWVAHPGKIAPDINRFFVRGQKPGLIALERDAETRCLCNPRLPVLLRELGVQSCRYDEI